MSAIPLEPLAALGAAAGLMVIVDRVAHRHSRRIIGRLPGDEAAIRTRWRAIRRLLDATIIAVGVLLALYAWKETRSIGTGLLASSAVIAVVIGFAAQTTLSNVLAGITLAFSQPIRLGDRVMIDETDGEIEQIGLSYTVVRRPDGSQVAYPNAVLAQKAIASSTLRDGRIVASAQVRVADASALERLRATGEAAGLSAVTARLSGSDADGLIAEATGIAATATAAREAESQLRGCP